MGLLSGISHVSPLLMKDTHPAHTFSEKDIPSKAPILYVIPVAFMLSWLIIGPLNSFGVSEVKNWDHGWTDNWIDMVLGFQQSTLLKVIYETIKIVQ